MLGQFLLESQDSNNELTDKLHKIEDHLRDTVEQEKSLILGEINNNNNRNKSGNNSNQVGRILPGYRPYVPHNYKLNMIKKKKNDPLLSKLIFKTNFD